MTSVQVVSYTEKDATRKQDLAQQRYKSQPRQRRWLTNFPSQPVGR